MTIQRVARQGERFYGGHTARLGVENLLDEKMPTFDIVLLAQCTKVDVQAAGMCIGIAANYTRDLDKVS
jgi:hypothetical protein